MNVASDTTKKSGIINPLNREVLILNRSFLPLGIDGARVAILNLYKGKAQAVDPKYRTYTFEEWVAATADLLVDAEEDEYNIIHTPNFPLLVPNVFRLTDHDFSSREWNIKFSRYHVLIRDNFTCQYCTKKFSRHELTIDHIMPKSRGGATSWDNCVATCKPCNHNKANKTPEEAGLVLLKPNPAKVQYDLRALLRHKKKKQWENFI